MFTATIINHLLRRRTLIWIVAVTTVFIFVCNKEQQNEQATVEIFNARVTGHGHGSRVGKHYEYLEERMSQKHQPIKIMKIVNPPQLTTSQEEHLANYYTAGDNKMLADRLSDVVQSQLKAIQTSTECNATNFICGHFDKCGLGCQVLHRAACLMISYALNLPFIHDEETGWPYSMKWSDLFEPMSTSCPPGNNTFIWNWGTSSLVLYRGTQNIMFPLREGLPVSKKLGDLVEKVHPNPILWWGGQFIKFALKPVKVFQDKLSLQKKAIGFSHPIAGFHVRRTDKITENMNYSHHIDEYFDVTMSQDLFTNLTVQGHVFIASDDSEVLPEAQTKYPNWKVTGFLASRTLSTQEQRVDGFEDIARDVLILSDCDFIVCGMSSNICRLLRLILNSKVSNDQQRIASLDGQYSYQLYGIPNLLSKIIKV